ncbi:MAG: hypothetical protein ACYTDX_09125 [Planctomycetota bacterium]|jgi:hypothetical protein
MSTEKVRPESVVYSIRIPAKPGLRTCGCCSTRFRASGPTGYVGEEMLCDRCLLLGDRSLGTVMALIAVSRVMAVCSYTTVEEYLEALREVGALIRVFERGPWTSWGPPRIFRMPGRPSIEGGRKSVDGIHR